MTNLDEFFSDDETRNVETLIAVTKKFFLFVSQLAEIVDSLEARYTDIIARLDNISQNAGQAPTQISASPMAPPPASTPAPVSTQAPSPPLAPPAAPTSLPTPPSFPTPPAPMEAQSTAPPPSVTATASPPPQQSFSPSNLPPLPGQTAAPPSQPGLSPPGPTGVPVGGTHPPGPAPGPSPMSLKAQMNMELKEAFSRIRKGWDEEK
ncbi:MAG: hypothetical protein KAT16_02220 [Candidatus Heimdallarchaeota archaeon]|nr:hypothetical protein [Candidatus Heimdallarchaeota archaeon]